jgi:hypothetical protein
VFIQCEISKASQAEEEREILRAVGMKKGNPYLLGLHLFYSGGNMVWYFPMPLIPIVH